MLPLILSSSASNNCKPALKKLPGGIVVEYDAFGNADQFATMRTDTKAIFGVVGKDYQIVQSNDAFAFFDAIVGGNEGILYETAGALGNGGTNIITAKLPGYSRMGNGDDVIQKYIFLNTSHDGSGSITAAFTPVLIIYQNTLNAAQCDPCSTHTP